MSQPHRKWLFFIPVALGVALFVALKNSNSGAEKMAAEERATAVRVITPPVLPVQPNTIAYGSVQPATVLSSVAEVAGEIEYV
ncbi:MAG: hypothetical protein ACPGSC_09595, partial [Granulosicoccaceae bacterium]